jgi:hypothetical protein
VSALWSDSVKLLTWSMSLKISSMICMITGATTGATCGEASRVIRGAQRRRGPPARGTVGFSVEERVGWDWHEASKLRGIHRTGNERGAVEAEGQKPRTRESKRAKARA